MNWNPQFRIEMLPAQHGDAIWIEYGQGPDLSRILIDGGTVGTFKFIEKRIHQLPAGEKVFELIVLSHVDADHVEGLVRLFAENPLPFVVDQVWYNGWRQMSQAHGLLGALQGEFLSALLARRAPSAWNPDSKPWVVPDNGKLPAYSLPGGMRLTLLSPSTGKLQRMAKAWKSTMSKAGIAPGDLEAAWKALSQRKKFLPKQGLLGAERDLDDLLKSQFVKDQAVPNGSSIAFLAEYGTKSALFLADAHPEVVANSIKRLCEERGVDRLAVDAVKVSHHGSKGNTSTELLGLIRSPWYLISTNGDQFEHPDQECIARILRHGKPERLYFNYLSPFTRPWLTPSVQKQHGFTSVVRREPELSLAIEL